MAFNLNFITILFLWTIVFDKKKIYVHIWSTNDRHGDIKHVRPVVAATTSSTSGVTLLIFEIEVTSFL